jgi:DNA-directed RNA polymerase specialized sigma24 family protein
MSFDRPRGPVPENQGALTEESFAALLSWLSHERNEAGGRYEEIRRRLIKFFACRGCRECEELADETINRVAKRALDVAGSYTGDPVHYFYGVANNVHLEHLRKKKVAALHPPPDATSSAELEMEYECLDRCMATLDPVSREIVLQYYQGEKGAKINYRQALAERTGLGANALRIRVHRVRAALRDCVLGCVAGQDETKTSKPAY